MHLLRHHSDLPEQPLRPAFANMAWRDDPAGLRAWQRGRTGVPIVDAGMRQLWHTGWMHNRVRMVVASFLVKHLLIPWQEGEAWFWDTLVDADLANNSASWQWVAGCGADAAPYFRVFNPVLQGRKFDPDGAYCTPLGPGTGPTGFHSHPCTVGGAGARAKTIRGQLSICPPAGGGRSRPMRRSAAVAHDTFRRSSARHFAHHSPGVLLRVVGDVHGDAAAFGYAAATDRFLVQLGDLHRLRPAQRRGAGHHVRPDRSGSRAVPARQPRPQAGPRARRAAGPAGTELAANIGTARRGDARPCLDRDRSRTSLAALEECLFVHGGFHTDMLVGPAPEVGVGRAQGAVARALFGEPTGRMQPDGYPERSLRWVDRIPRGLTVYCGHDRRSTNGRPYVRQGALGGLAVFLDTGAGKGGHLSWIDL